MKKHKLILRIIFWVNVLLIIGNIFTSSYGSPWRFYGGDGSIVSRLMVDVITLLELFLRSTPFLITPFLILYFTLKDYFLACYQNEKIKFTKSFFKGIKITILILLVVWVFFKLTCSGESCMVLLFAPLIIGVGGLVSSALFSWITYFLSKRNLTG